MTLPDPYQGDELTSSPALSSPLDATAAAGSDRLDVRRFIAMFRRRLLMFVTIILICFLLAVLVTARQPREYSASSDLVINLRQESVVPSEVVADADALPRAEEMDTQLKIIRSQELAAQVVDATGLLRDADLVAQATEQAKFKMPVSLLRERIGELLVSGLRAERLDTAYAIRLTYVDGDPVRAARIVNAFARVYADNQRNMKAGEARKTIAMLETRIDQLRTQALADFGAVQDFRVRNNLLSANATQLGEQETASYDQQLASARASAAEHQARFNAALNQMVRGSSGGDNASALASPVIQSLRTQRAAISARVADLSGRYLDDHPDLVSARRQLADLDSQIQTEINRTMSGLGAAAQAANQQAAIIGGQRGSARAKLADNNAALVGLDDLNRKAQASQALYESYLSRYKEAVAGAGTEQAKARIVTIAKVPEHPTSPRVALNLALGILLGVLLGSVAVITSESIYEGLTTSEDIERRIGLRSLGGIPLLGSVEPSGADPADTVARYPGSAFAESFRSFLTALRQSRSSRNQVIAITSALPGEGKSSIALSLARAAANGGETVIVIDCDPVRFNLSRMCGGDVTKPGLREILKKGATLGDALIKDAASNAMILPITSRFEDGERLLEQGHLHRLIALLREHFALIILDCAPILPVAETREIVVLADNVAIVVLWRKTSEVVLRAALKLLPLGALGDAGILLNRIDMKKQARFGFGDANSFYSHYKAYLPGA